MLIIIIITITIIILCFNKRDKKVIKRLMPTGFKALVMESINQSINQPDRQ